MALQFPNSPSVGQIYIDTASGFSYEWDGTVWKSFSEASASQISILDDISNLFDGVETSFALTSSSLSVTPVSSQSLIINLGGVVQDPSDDYGVTGSNLIFSTPPTAGLTFSGVLLGSAFSITRTEIQSVDDTSTNSSFYPVIVASTNADAKISTTKLSFNPSSGALTATSFVGNLTGNATGLSGTPNITVGSVTSGNINSSGVVTATTFVGNVTGNATGLSGSPSITVTGVNASGVITATSFSGSGANLTGISSVSFATTSFALSGSPAILVSSAGVNTTSAPSKLYVQGNAASNIVGLGSTSGTVTLNFTQGNSFSLTLTGNTTLANPTGVTTGQSGVILIQEDGTGGYAVAWGSSWDFASSTAPTLTTTASALNALPYFARSTTSIVVGSVIAGIGTL